MKTSEHIKNKVFLKLKEINSSKGETNAKAQQYLDGLLKIPFGIYKKESILTFLEDFINFITSYCTFIKTNLMNNNNLYLQNIYNICKTFLDLKINKTSKYLENFIISLINNLKLFIKNQEQIHKHLLKLNTKN